MFQHIRIDVDWQVRVVVDGQGDGVAGAAVDLNHIATALHADFGEVGVLAQVADDDVLSFAAESLDRRLEQIVSQRALRIFLFDAAVDAGRLEQADQDWKHPLAIDFAEVDHLLVVEFADDDAGKFHRHEHGTPLVVDWPVSRAEL